MSGKTAKIDIYYTSSPSSMPVVINKLLITKHECANLVRLLISEHNQINARFISTPPKTLKVAAAFGAGPPKNSILLAGLMHASEFTVCRYPRHEKCRETQPWKLSASGSLLSSKHEFYLFLGQLCPSKRSSGASDFPQILSQSWRNCINSA